MKVVGWWLIVAGVAALVLGWFLETAVERYSGDVLNIGLLQQQMMVWALGLALLVSGVIVAALGTIAERLSTTSGGENDEDRFDPSKVSDVDDNLPSRSRRAGMGQVAHDLRVKPGAEGAQP